MKGYGGDDDMFGREGNDNLWAHADDDYLKGGYGNDRHEAGPGNDEIVSRFDYLASDRINCGDGVDVVHRDVYDVFAIGSQVVSAAAAGCETVFTYTW